MKGSTSKMNYRRLGSTGLKISEIGLGGWITFGNQLDEERSRQVIQKAFDIGINFFDCADVYAEGRSEEFMGNALAQFPREELVIATKARGRIFKGPNGEGLSRKHLIEACNASLRRMKVDYIDLYQVHWWDPETPIAETMEALNDLVRQGKVLYIGCSNYSVEQLRDALAVADQNHWSRFVSVQPCYNMITRQVEADLFPRIKTEGIGAVVYCPLAQGLLTGKYAKSKKPSSETRLGQMKNMADRLLTDQNLSTVSRLQKIADRLRRPMSQLALAWILRREEVSSAIIGATSVEQLKENVKASSVKLKPRDLEEIEKVLASATEAARTL
jgi:aryl-alcohol dehydrogenase-like predicted oxidoreductase